MSFDLFISLFFQLRPRSTHEHDEYLDKSSQSFDCDPSPPLGRKKGGSYTNLFDSGGPGSNHASAPTTAVGATVNNNIGKGPGSPPCLRPAQIRNTYERAGGKPGTYNTQNGGSNNFSKAPIVIGEDDTLQQGDGPAINSPGIKRNLSHDKGFQNPNVDRNLPPRAPSSKPSTRVSSPNHSTSPTLGTHRGRPPQSPSASRPADNRTLDSGLRAASPIRDRARNFYPSRSRENLVHSNEQLNLSKESLSSSRAGNNSFSNTFDAKAPSIREQYSRSSDRINNFSDHERSRGDGQSPAPYSRTQSRSRDFVDNSGIMNDIAGEKPYKDPQRRNDAQKQNSQNNSEILNKHQYPSKERDRSKSFDFDPPRERSKSRERTGLVRERSLPRNISAKTGYGDGDRSEASSFISNHSAHTFSGYPMPPSTHLSSGSLGRPGTNSLPGGSISPRSPTSSRYPLRHQPISMPGPPQSNHSLSNSAFAHHPSNPSIASRHPSQSSMSSHADSGRPMTFVRAGQVMDAVEIRDRRINERLRRQSQSNRKESAKSVYDTYEASV